LLTRDLESGRIGGCARYLTAHLTRRYLTSPRENYS
jgi:hypothetical protein